MIQYEFSKMDQLKALIREVPDFPKPGINFYDTVSYTHLVVGLRRIPVRRRLPGS